MLKTQSDYEKLFYATQNVILEASSFQITLEPKPGVRGTVILSKKHLFTPHSFLKSYLKQFQQKAQLDYEEYVELVKYWARLAKNNGDGRNG